ncbi:MAG: endonuclease/exonuclease/phosphatase family protein, partial [Muribaculaceae bacterium]|nr:endonuclease/exonuclease/phosphatase family protein [Muribaculaceae bacterium]
GVLPLIFPVMLCLAVIMTITDLFLCRRLALLPISALLLCGGPIFRYCPVHPFKESYAETDRTFTLLTYNAFHFNSILPDGDPYPDGINPTMDYIINSQADIVALQECVKLKPTESLHITSAQIDSIYSRYPYIYIEEGRDNGILSKWPMEIKPVFKETPLANSVIAVDIFIGNDTLRLYSVHLESFQLSEEDKKIYHDIAKLEGSREELKAAKSVLLSKIARANRLRAIQADSMYAILNRNTARDIIICGDFNDVPESYTLRTISGSSGGLRQAYTEAGNGPMVTYNRRSFPFRIDHILYRGAIKPIKVWHGDILSSDHYPLFATFVLPHNNSDIKQ